MATAPKSLTLEQFLEMPETKPALEFSEGRITPKVSPKGKHSRLQGVWITRLDGFARPKRLGGAFPELRTAFAGSSYVPDVAFYRSDRIPRDDQGRVADDFREPPDLVVEIVSPEQSVNALVRKCLWYVAHGVAVALLVDPDDESILLFRPNQIPRVLAPDEAIDLADILPGFSLTGAEVFSSLRD